MATLAEAVDAAETDWLVSADIPDSVDYLTVGSEVVQVTATFPAQYQARDGSTSDPRIRVVRAAGGTTAASHADTTALTPLIPPSAGGGAAEAGVNIDNTVDPPFLADTFTAPGVYDAGGGVAGWDGVLPTADQKGAMDQSNAADANNAFATIADLGALPGPQDLAAVLAEGNDTGGVQIVHIPAVDVDAETSRAATATGSGEGLGYSQVSTEDGDADARDIAIATGTGTANARSLAVVGNIVVQDVHGVGGAIAGPWAEASGSGNTDACTYARSVDGDALADNDAAASGTGNVDAGCYAAAVDGTANAAGYASTTGTGVATVGAKATGTGGSAGMIAVADAVSGRMGFNGVTPIVRPELPATGVLTEQDIADVLVALGLVTQAA